MTGGYGGQLCLRDQVWMTDEQRQLLYRTGWPTLPPRPSVDEVEGRKRLQEEVGKPKLQKTVKYQMSYGVGEQKRTLSTNYEVYRQVVKAYPSRTPLQLTLGVNDNSVQKAQRVDSINK